MKRSTLIFATAGMILTGAAVVQVLGGGDAAAAVPVLDAPNGYVAVALTTSETAALGASPLTDAFDTVVPGSAEGIALHQDSKLRVANGQLLGGTSDVAAEAANHPGGYVSLYATYPGNTATSGYPFLITQHWN